MSVSTLTALLPTEITNAFTKFLKSKVRSALRYTGEDDNGKKSGVKIIKLPKKRGAKA
jgi:hypothetical protein